VVWAIDVLHPLAQSARPSPGSLPVIAQYGTRTL
jgi:hypothetical protein